MTETIRITLKLFAIYQETVGAAEQSLSLPAGTTAAEVCDRIIAEYPSLAPWRELTRFGVNLQFVPGDAPLHSGDELVLIPPVSGG